MATYPKRVWTGKKLVYSGKKPVWELDGKVGVYNPNFTEVSEGETYTDRWDSMEASDELVTYDGLTKSEYIGIFEDGTEAEYVFEDYDGTELKTGKVKDGKTPVAPTDPTREGYTFTGWDPEVGPISKDTTYTATYEENAADPVDLLNEALNSEGE